MRARYTDGRTRGLAAIVTIALLTVAVPLAPTGSAAAPGCPDDQSDHWSEYCTDSIQDAIDNADPGDAVIVSASSNGPNPTPYPEAIEVDTPGLTLCSYEDASGQDPGPVFVASTTDRCGQRADAAVIDATGQGRTVVHVTAEDVTIRDLTVTWSGDVETESAVGIAVDAPGAEIVRTQVEMPGGWCSAAEDGVCGGARVVGVYADAGVTVRDSALTTTGVNPDDPTDFAGTWGLNANDDAPIVVDNVTFRGWAIGSINWAPNLEIRDATFEANLRGVQTAAGQIRVEGSTFLANDAAVYVAGQSRPEDVTLRGNDLGLSNRQALAFKEARTDTVVDARANHWGVVGRDVIPQRFAQADDNVVHYMPYEDAAGNLHPPAPDLFCQDQGFIDPADEVLTLQQALDASLPTGCDPADGRTVIVHPDAEAYDPAVVDEPATIVSAGIGNTPTARDARVRATADQPALAFGGDSQADPGSAVAHLTFELGEDGTGVVATSSEASVAGLVVEDSRFVGGDVGVAARDGAGVDVRSNVFARTTTGVAFEATTGGTVESNRIVGALTAVELTAADDVAVLDNQLVGPGPRQAPDGTGDPTVGVRLRSGSSSWTVQGNTVSDFGFAGVAVSSGTQAGTIDGNTIEDTWRFGVYVGQDVPDVRIVDNTIERFGLNGINLEDTAGTLVESNRISLAALPGANLPDGAPFDQVPAAGLWVQATDGVAVRDNTFTGSATEAILVSSFQGEQPDLEPLRLNEFVLVDAPDPGQAAQVNVPSVWALRVDEGVEDVTIDARLNDWGVYEHQLVRQRVRDQGTGNQVQMFPYLMPNGPHGLPLP